MEESDFSEISGGDVAVVGFAPFHQMIFDFDASADDAAVQFGSKLSWVGPSNLFQRVLESGYKAPEGVDRAVYNFDFNQLPQPGFLSRLFGYDSQRERIYILTKAALRYSRLYGYLGRAPTQEEVDIFTKTEAYAYCVSTTYPAVFLLLGGIRESWTAAQGRWHNPLPLRFPRSYERRASFRPGAVNIFGREIRGPAAHTLQRVWRMSKYGLVGYIAGQILTTSQLTSAGMTVLNDPKLREMSVAHNKMMNTRKAEAMKAIRERRNPSQVPKTDSALQEPKVIRTVDQPTRDPTGQGPTNMLEKWRRHRVSIGASEARQDENDSTSASGDMYDSYSSAQPETAESQRLGDDQDSSSTVPNASVRRSQGRYFGQAQDAIPERAVNTDFFETTNDASPEPQKENGPDATRPQGTGSAWDRVRRGEVQQGSKAQRGWNSISQNTRSAQDQRQSFSEQGNSLLDPGQGDLSKTQAQKEFDAMLERERSGEEASSPSRRW